MAACNSMLLYHFLGLASLAAVFYFSLLGEVNLRFPGLLPSPRSSMIQPLPHDASIPFVERRGVQLFLEDRPFYINGWNSYWLMAQSVETSSRHRVSGMFRAATGMGLTVCRTWAFNDGGYNALQLAPGRFDERVFKALDRVLVEARQHGVRLILSLADNLEAYGGKTQYVKWAWDEGVGLTASNDSFFFDPAIRDYFKVYIKVKSVAASSPKLNETNLLALHGRKRKVSVAI
jgi:mannan endo-1,4-beta-mannosidase